MGEYHVLEDGLIVSHGYCQDGSEQLHAQEGQTIRLGAPLRESRFWKELPPIGYMELRIKEYPHVTEFLDAYVKISSGNGRLVTEGNKQMQDYIAKCLDIKARIPVGTTVPRPRSMALIG